MSARLRHRHCSTCETVFQFGVAEQEFYTARQLKPPNRCRACRALARFEREGRPATIEICTRCGERFACLATAIQDGRPILCTDCRPLHGGRS